VVDLVHAHRNELSSRADERRDGFVPAGAADAERALSG
jgi:hypothetical protein